jgi:hypothetical protein
MNETYAALLDEQWVLDVDATVKTLYGRQEEARVGYNPRLSCDGIDGGEAGVERKCRGG